jgi:hypothetical protein
MPLVLYCQPDVDILTQLRMRLNNSGMSLLVYWISSKGLHPELILLLTAEDQVDQ